MITRLEVKNFKGWKKLNISTKSLCGLFGTNSSGKTSIIQSLLMMKQTAESTDRAQILHLGDLSTFVDLGTYSDVIFNHAIENPLNISIAWKTEKPVVINDPTSITKKNLVLFSGQDIKFSVEIKESSSKRLFVEKFAYEFDDSIFSMERTGKRDRYEYRLTHNNIENSVSKFKFIRSLGRKWSLPHPIKFYGFPDQVNAYFQNTSFLSELQLLFEKQLGKIFYLGPLREDPQRQYTWGGTTSPQDMGRRGEQVIDAMLSSKVRGVKISRGTGKKRFTVEEYVAFWLKELKLIDSFRVAEIAPGSGLYRVLVKRNSSSSEVLIPDVGFGVSQILPVITLCYYAPEGSTLLIEQPEIHLHPKVQAGLADVFIDAIKNRRLQIIVESHSEYFIKRLQRRIAEGKFSNQDSSLFFCDHEVDQSVIEELKIDEFGSISNWPKDFFGDEFTEVAMTAKAIIKRKKALRSNGIHN